MPQTDQASSQNPVVLIESLKSIVDQYETFLLDQWGVIHDGVNLHPGAFEAMRELKRTGKQVIILSNSGKRASESHTRMGKLGIGREYYGEIITSGELVYQNLKSRSDPFYRQLGETCKIFAWDDDRGIIEGLGVAEVTNVQDASFILCAGTDQQALEAYRPDLTIALERNLPMICANPDKVSVQPDGSLKMCPGAVAELYENMGGTVRWHGKPTAEVYAVCEGIAGNLQHAIGVGDSLIHDIKGAREANIDALLICGGIHKDEIGTPITVEQITKIAHDYGAVPTYATPLFCW